MDGNRIILTKLQYDPFLRCVQDVSDVSGEFFYSWINPVWNNHG